MKNLTIDKREEIDNLSSLEEAFEYQSYRVDKTNGDMITKLYRDYELISLQLKEKGKDSTIHMLKPIPDFPNLYADLRNGLIWNERVNAFSKASKPNRYGYIYSSFTNKFGDIVPISIHSLIMSAHKEVKPEIWNSEGLEINHIDSDKTNNSIENLELLTAKENIKHYYENRTEAKREAKRLNEQQVQTIKFVATYLKVENKYKQSNICHYYSNKFSVDYVTVFNVLTNRSFKNVELSDEQKEDIKLLVAEKNKLDIENDIELLSKLSA